MQLSPCPQGVKMSLSVQAQRSPRYDAKARLRNKVAQVTVKDTILLLRVHPLHDQMYILLYAIVCAALIK